MSTKAKQKEKSELPSVNKRKSKRFKLIGGTILLISFITQWTFINYAQSQQNNWNFGLDAYSRAYLASLSYLNLYFTQGQTTGVYDGVILNKAAQENALGFSSRILIASKFSRQEKAQRVNRILEASRNVKDPDSYNSYMALVNEIEKETISQSQEEIDRLSKLQSTSLWIYAVSYIIGSVLLLWGLRYE
jgi:hypothetical protein